ncbi:styrene monooxygenase/indole monooxygenase family protein [Kutzneria chonburiensis]|uniref:Styrene monooxygenase/indole monooxygenase family protein n=1 Tax=Kutzneria chonburiensis TaxID=1483604 RepID=A0ABV6MVP3_9PSEU|nr:styrene monooxygenase/indole monooxygenase family protein [Kutzneria chonburiensis]
MIVGAGQSGLLLALGLQKHGYDVTVVADRHAEAVRTGPMLSCQLVFGPALALERELGVDFWTDEVPLVTDVSFTAAATPDAKEPAIAWTAGLTAPAAGVDQRLRMAAWLEEFDRRGGEIRYQRATVGDIDEFAREFDLVVVAAGRGEQFERLFPRNDEQSPYLEPQRFLSPIYVRLPDGESLTSALRFGMGPVGEISLIPGLTSAGPVMGVGMFAVPGGPMDVWADIHDTDQHFELARTLIRKHFPWRAEIIEHAEPAGPLMSLRGRLTPIVRHAVGTLPSGAPVLALGDTAVTNDPLGGQGGNMAAHAARSYRDAIVAQGDRAFDEQFMRSAFARYWAVAEFATRFSNDLLAPPAEHVGLILKTAEAVPEVGRRFAGVFENPTDYTEWLTDKDAALKYLHRVR